VNGKQPKHTKPQTKPRETSQTTNHKPQTTNHKPQTMNFTQEYYNETYNVTKYLPTYEELLEEVFQRTTKSSRSRMLNNELKGALEMYNDLKDAVENHNGRLFGAVHTKKDVLKYLEYIAHVLKCIELNKNN